jgi:hypothetical protein
MHDTISMHSTHCRGYFIKDVAGLLLGEVVAIDDDVKQLLSLAILGHDVLVFCFFKDLVYLEYAGMVLREVSTTCV